jgi:hypothetical protein
MEDSMKLVALVAGAALALVPSGTAFAGDTGNGKALGNCTHSSAGGVHAPLFPEHGHGKGNGGLRDLAGKGCTPTPPPPAELPGDESTDDLGVIEF